MEYSLPGVMRYLQSEWQRNERDRIQWELERAEMKTRIAKLEGENRGLQLQIHSQARRIRSLTQQAHDSVLEDEVSDLDRLLQAAPDLGSLLSSRRYLEQCIQEIDYLLQSAPIEQSDYAEQSDQNGQAQAQAQAQAQSQNQGQSQGQTKLQSLDKQSLDKQGLDKQSLDKQGLDKQGLDKQGLDKQSLDKQSLDKQSLDKQSLDKQSLDKQDNQGQEQSSLEQKQDLKDPEAKAPALARDVHPSKLEAVRATEDKKDKKDKKQKTRQPQLLHAFARTEYLFAGVIPAGVVSIARSGLVELHQFGQAKEPAVLPNQAPQYQHHTSIVHGPCALSGRTLAVVQVVDHKRCQITVVSSDSVDTIPCETHITAVDCLEDTIMAVSEGAVLQWYGRELVASTETDNSITAILCLDVSRALVGTSAGAVLVVNVAAGSFGDNLSTSTSAITHLARTPTPDTVAVAYKDGTVVVLNVSSQTKIHTMSFGNELRGLLALGSGTIVALLSSNEFSTYAVDGQAKELAQSLDHVRLPSTAPVSFLGVDGDKLVIVQTRNQHLQVYTV